MSWFELAALPLGLLTGWSYVRLAQRLPAYRMVVLASGLVCAALIYVTAALLVGTSRAVLVEAVGLSAFAAFAVLGVRRAWPWLAAGWALHMLWDLAAQAAAQPVLPLWYAAACLGFDSVVAIAILRQAQQPMSPNRAQ